MTLDQYIVELQKLRAERIVNGELLMVCSDSRYGFLPLGKPQIARVSSVRGVSELPNDPKTVVIV